MKIASSEAMPSIKEFFPSIKNDLTKVTWAQRVFSDEIFQQALEAKKMMIAGEVTMITTRAAKFGKKAVQSLKMYYKNKKQEKQWGMNLKEILKKAADSKSVGVRLNFDQITTFGKAIKVLQAMSGELKFPLWLHADTENMEDKDIDKFLSLCTHNFPKATISIGMLHGGQKFESNQFYTAKLVTQMKDTLTRNNVTQTVAFPVEISRAAYSLDTLPTLKDVHGITDSALYMYARSSKFYNYDELSGVRKLIKIFGKNRVYLDATKYEKKEFLKI